MTHDLATSVELFPALKDKCTVRLIGRLNNVKEQSRVQQEKQGFVNEVVGFITGETRRRQDFINKQLTDVVEDIVDQLAEVMDAVSFNNRTLGMIVDELKNLQSHTESIAYEVIEIKEKLAQLEYRVHHRFCLLTEAVEEIDCRMKAQQEMDIVFHRWDSGSLNALPIALRGYSVFEQLWWGDFGFYVQQYPGFEADKLLQYLRVRATACFSKDLQVQPKVRIPRERWLSVLSDSAIHQPVINQGVELLSDWATKEGAPFVSLVCNRSPVNQDLLAVPHLFSAERLGRELVGELFVNRDAA